MYIGTILLVRDLLPRNASKSQKKKKNSVKKKIIVKLLKKMQFDSTKKSGSNSFFKAKF